jgi:hypothetical protein
VISLKTCISRGRQIAQFRRKKQIGGETFCGCKMIAPNHVHSSLGRTRTSPIVIEDSPPASERDSPAAPSIVFAESPPNTKTKPEISANSLLHQNRPRKRPFVYNGLFHAVSNVSNQSKRPHYNPRELRSQFRYTDFENSSSLLKRLAVIATPMEVSKEQQDALAKLNPMDLKNMGIWKAPELLVIMKQLTHVKTEDIKHFFVRLKQ